MGTLNLEGFPKAWIQRGLREIHHVNDNMDGRMDACLGYTAVLGAERGWTQRGSWRTPFVMLKEGEIADLKA